MLLALGADLPLSSIKKLDPNSKTEANDDFTFSINMSGGRSEIVGSPCKIGQNGGKVLHGWESLISATSVTTVDTDSCVDSFASMSLDSNASSSNTESLISATSVTTVDTDSCVDSFASMSLDSNASSSNTKGMGMSSSDYYTFVACSVCINVEFLDYLQLATCSHFC